jgi:hypothetical protein
MSSRDFDGLYRTASTRTMPTVVAAASRGRYERTEGCIPKRASNPLIVLRLDDALDLDPRFLASAVYDADRRDDEADDKYRRG